MCVYIVVGSLELAAAKCDMSQEPTAITDSSNYYSTVGFHSCAKQINSSDVVYKVSKKSFFV